MTTAAARTSSQVAASSLRSVYAALLLVLGGSGCSLEGLLTSDELPKDVNDPALTRTPDGARAAYHGTLARFRGAFGGAPDGGQPAVIVHAGLLADELMSGASFDSLVDQRNLPEGSGDYAGAEYSALQKIRGQGGQAIALLTRYLPEQPALAGHLYAIQGYAEIFLAELFCSGVPLSTLDFDGDFTYRPGSTTEQLFAHAVALFDTALTLAGDSARFADLARVGRARALLGTGAYAEAAAAVNAVADGYHYAVYFNNVTGAGSARNFARIPDHLSTWDLTVPDGEGFNGLNWRSSGDPRSAVTLSNGRYHPNKYAMDGAGPIVLASSIEARLIEAEAALHAGSAVWLTILNTLRTDGTFDTTATSPPDTLWHAGSGGVAGLEPLSDPGTTDGRVDLVFRERAFWLFLTGQRQGDLRRLIRQYGREEGDLYPVGPYPGAASPYGADVTIPIPTSEFANPLYTGCVSRAA